MPQRNVANLGHSDASNPCSTSRLVLGGISCFNRHTRDQRCSTSAATWTWILSDCVVHVASIAQGNGECDSRTKLAGVVEADEAFVGGPAKEKRGRGVAKASNKSMIAGTVEVVTYTTKSGVTKEMAGRLRLAIIENGNEETIGGFLRSNVDKGAKVRSDGWKGYSKLALSGYEHEIRIVGPSKRAHLVAPHIHRVFGNLKTWLRGTHHGVEPKYLASYLQEFVFRFNRRQTPMAAFQTLLGITASKSPITLTELRS